MFGTVLQGAVICLGVPFLLKLCLNLFGSSIIGEFGLAIVIMNFLLSEDISKRDSAIFLSNSSQVASSFYEFILWPIIFKKRIVHSTSKSSLLL